MLLCPGSHAVPRTVLSALGCECGKLFSPPEGALSIHLLWRHNSILNSNPASSAPIPGGKSTPLRGSLESHVGRFLPDGAARIAATIKRVRSLPSPTRRQTRTRLPWPELSARGRASPRWASARRLTCSHHIGWQAYWSRQSPSDYLQPLAAR